MLHGHPVKTGTDSVSSMTTNSTTADKLIREKLYKIICVYMKSLTNV